MKRSSVVKWLGGLGLFAAGLIAGKVASTFWERPQRSQGSEQLESRATASADLALAAADKGDLEQAAVLMRQAIRRAQRAPDSFFYLWNAVQRIGGGSTPKPQAREIRRELVAGLDAALVDAESAEDFATLYKLRSAIAAGDGGGASSVSGKCTETQSIASPVEKFTSAQPPPQPKGNQKSTNPVDLLRSGLQALADGEEDRAELLTQAALKAQTDQPEVVPDLWKEYRSYLEKNSKLTPYDRLARLSAYLDSVDASLVACRNVAAFQTVWPVRRAILVEQTKSHADLLREVDKAIADLADKMKKTAGEHDPLGAMRLIASQADELKPRILILLATGREKGGSAAATPTALRPMLDDVLNIVTAEVVAIRKRADLAAARKGESVNPTKSDKQYGEYETVLRDTNELVAVVDAMDLQSWLSMIVDSAKGAKGKGNGGRDAKMVEGKADDGLERKLLQSMNDLEQLRGEVSRLQGIRYNLWALRSIYEAESSDNWDSVLARIDVGLLHPTVNALYSMTYDELMKQHKAKDQLMFARMVQNILTSKKLGLSAF